MDGRIERGLRSLESLFLPYNGGRYPKEVDRVKVDFHLLDINKEKDWHYEGTLNACHYNLKEIDDCVVFFIICGYEWFALTNFQNRPFGRKIFFRRIFSNEDEDVQLYQVTDISINYTENKVQLTAELVQTSNIKEAIIF